PQSVDKNDDRRFSRSAQLKGSSIVGQFGHKTVPLDLLLRPQVPVITSHSIEAVCFVCEQKSVK
ncbi:MAG: hypothetical protein ACR2OM_12845, partial [Aestuariivirgaceae bacterium]